MVELAETLGGMGLDRLDQRLISASSAAARSSSWRQYERRILRSLRMEAPCGGQVTTVIEMKIEQAAEEFLSCRRIAVTGVSHAPKGHGSNAVYQRLRQRGYDVFAVNPNAQTVEGDQAYADLRSIPGGVEAVVIGTRPEHALDTVREAGELGITRVWMHRSVDAGSVSPEAAAYAREHAITVIEGGCPLMFGQASDGGHKVMCWVLKLTGSVPRTV